MRRETFRREYVRCGRAGCRSCPHGPYWYAYWREGGRTRKRYIGKELPAGCDPVAVGLDVWEQIVEAGRATPDQALALLGLSRQVDWEAVKQAYARMAYLNHPDRGGSALRMSALNLAWETLRAWYGR